MIYLNEYSSFTKEKSFHFINRVSGKNRCSHHCHAGSVDDISVIFSCFDSCWLFYSSFADKQPP